MSVSPLGLGNGSLGITEAASGEAEQDAEAIAATHAAVAGGISYIDTCPQYRDGMSDRRVGRALARDGLRSTVTLAAKVGTHPSRPGYDKGAVQWTVAENLEALQTDRLDVVFFHDPDDMGDIMKPGGGLDALEMFKAQGTVGAVGLAVQNHRFQRRALASGRFDAVLLPYDFNLIRRTADPLLDTAASQDVAVVVASPFQQGLLAGVDPDEANRVRLATKSWPARPGDLECARILWRWASERDVDLRALALQFCLREPRITTTLVGPRSVYEVTEILESAQTPIPESVWTELPDVLDELPPPSPGGEASVGKHPPIE